MIDVLFKKNTIVDQQIYTDYMCLYLYKIEGNVNIATIIIFSIVNIYFTIIISWCYLSKINLEVIYYDLYLHFSKLYFDNFEMHEIINHITFI